MKKGNIKNLSVIALIVMLTCLNLNARAYASSKDAGTTEVNEIPYTVNFSGKSYSGTYSGTVEDNMPADNGTFVADMPKGCFEYTGSWEKGQIIGDGTIKNSEFEIVLNNGASRIGNYEGTLIAGKPDGFGTFTTKNDEGVTWNYTGEWKDGLFNGKGIFKLENGYLEEGTFTNGDFTPTPAEFLLYTAESCYGVSVDADTKSLVKKLEPFIIEGDISEYQEEIEREFDFDDFLKHPEEYSAKVFQLPGYIIQTGPDDYFPGIESAYAIFRQPEKNNAVYLTYNYGHISNDIKNYNVSMTIVPLGEYAFQNGSGNDVTCILCAVISYKII